MGNGNDGGGADWQGTGGVVTYTIGQGFSGTVIVDDNNFQVEPDQVHQWLVDHGLLGRQVQVQQQPLQSIPQGPAPGNGVYQWENYSTADPNLTDGQREDLNEQSSQRWGGMLDAWNLFQKQLAQLAQLTDGDAIISKVCDAIAALGMLELHDWGPPYVAEFAAWVGLSAASSTPANLQAAANAITQAGYTLISQWRARMDQGNYESYDLTGAQHAFVTACTTARGTL